MFNTLNVYQRQVVQNIRRGQNTAWVGQSGMGKTYAAHTAITLLPPKAVTLYITPQDGEVALLRKMFRLPNTDYINADSRFMPAIDFTMYDFIVVDGFHQMYEHCGAMWAGLHQKPTKMKMFMANAWPEMLMGDSASTMYLRQMNKIIQTMREQKWVVYTG